MCRCCSLNFCLFKVMRLYHRNNLNKTKMYSCYEELWRSLLATTCLEQKIKFCQTQRLALVPKKCCLYTNCLDWNLVNTTLRLTSLTSRPRPFCAICIKRYMKDGLRLRQNNMRKAWKRLCLIVCLIEENWA